MQQQDIRTKIWTALNLLRTDKHFSGARDIKVLELMGAKFDSEKLDQILADKELISKITNIYALTPPNHLLDFISELINSKSNQSIFDPWLTLSSPALYFQNDNLQGICRNQVEYEIINRLFKEQAQKYILGEPFSQIEQIREKYDLIISFPPFGIKTEHINGIKSSTDFATALLLQCEPLLENGGKLLFLLSNSFLIEDNPKKLLENAGLFVEAVFSVISGTFAPLTNIPSSLVLVSKEKVEKTFVAEISQDETINKTILQNFKNKRIGKALQLGGLVDIKEYKSFNSLVSEKEMQEMVRRIGYPPILLTDFSISINAIKAENIEDVEHLPNSIYLPKVGNSPVVASLSELKIKPRNYYQIQLNDKIANAIYVANYFNTPTGRKLRESLEIGAVIPQISKSQLLKCVLYLPELSIQAELIEIDSKIQQFSLKLDELKRNLWKQPKNYKSIAKELKTINQEEKLENWIDKLPFPISSILWRYYATKNNSKKIEHLFHFFEAFSEFLSMIMLSALVQDKEFYSKESYKWIDKDERFKDWYLRATFGNWNNLTSNLSKAIRGYINNKEEKDYCKSLFGNPSDAFFSMISSREIVNILFLVANLRNSWKGHGGITSEEENNQRVLTLEQQLNELRRKIADAFDDTKMLSPTTSSFEDGIFTFNAKELIGARTPFNEITIKSLIPLDRKKLYLSNSEQTKPLELLPFIKFIESSDAIYFYTSIESKNVRWVSYHFDKEAEINQPADNELFKAFDFFKPRQTNE